MLAILCLTFVQGLEPYPPSRFDRVFPITIDAEDPQIEGRGRAERFEYVAEFSGTLHLWTSATNSSTTDPWLRVENADGTLVGEDDDSGGGKTPYLELKVQTGRVLMISAAVWGDSGRHAFQLHAIAGAETLESSSAANSADESLAEIKRLRESGELESARELATGAMEQLVQAKGIVESELAHRLLWKHGFETQALGLPQLTREAWTRIVQYRTRTLPAEHADLQRARGNLAAALKTLGDIPGARALQESILEVLERTRSIEHLDLQLARAELAYTLEDLNDFAGARVLKESVLEACVRTLSADNPLLQAARVDLASTLWNLGDLAGARVLEEAVLEVRARTLPADHPDLQSARAELAKTLKALGDLNGARALQEAVLEVRSRILPADHPDLQAARVSLALTLKALGDLSGAQALEEIVIEVRARSLPPDHLDLQAARVNLASTLREQGNLSGARALEEPVLEVFARTLPADHSYFQAARTNMANTLFAQGDLSGARVLQEAVLEVSARTLPAEHRELQAARHNLAVTLGELGDLSGARALQEAVLEVLARTLPAEHPRLQTARASLANTLADLNDLAGARALQETVLTVSSHTLPAEHLDLQAARGNLAATLATLGDFAGARALEEAALDVCRRTLPDEHPWLQSFRGNLAMTIANEWVRIGAEGGREGSIERDRDGARCAELLSDRARSQSRAAQEVVLLSPAREAEVRCAQLATGLNLALSFAQGYGTLEPFPVLESPCFALSELTRGAAFAAASVARAAGADPRYNRLRQQLRQKSDELARITQSGTTGEVFAAAQREREAAERALMELGRDFGVGTNAGTRFEAATLSSALEDGIAAVGFRRFKRSIVDVIEELDSTGQPALSESTVDHLCAFVVCGSSIGDTTPAGEEKPPLQLLDLGPIAPIVSAVERWRNAISIDRERGLGAASDSNNVVRASGEEVRRLVFDPLLTATGEAKRIVVALDDALHLVPLDALPLSDSSALVGDRWCIETRATLTELLEEPAAPDGTVVLTLGGPSFNLEPLGLDAENAAAIEAAADNGNERQVAAILRGGNWERGFDPLTHSAAEARGVGALHQELFGDECPIVVLEGRRASRSALTEIAPKARFLHVATHGWFAPESIKSWSDPRPLDQQSGLGLRMTGEETIRGMSPMLLCGLALAGANLPEDSVGRPPGLITADELSTLDLSGCELAVLSACDTNVGVRRAGQGVASLQKALQMAGARTVITSLWKVPDEATKDLMLDFYRRIWVDKTPKTEALWAAKMRMRDAKDERGQPRYSVRDWAGWVLTGDPN